jgi:hypothetical protein
MPSAGTYVKALKPLGYELAMEFGQAAGFGIGGKPDFGSAPVAFSNRPCTWRSRARSRAMS